MTSRDHLDGQASPIPFAEQLKLAPKALERPTKGNFDFFRQQFCFLNLSSVRNNYPVVVCCWHWLLTGHYWLFYWQWLVFWWLFLFNGGCWRLDVMMLVGYRYWVEPSAPWQWHWCTTTYPHTLTFLSAASTTGGCLRTPHIPRLFIQLFFLRFGFLLCYFWNILLKDLV